MNFPSDIFSMILDERRVIMEKKKTKQLKDTMLNSLEFKEINDMFWGIYNQRTGCFDMMSDDNFDHDRGLFCGIYEGRSILGEITPINFIE